MNIKKYIYLSLTTILIGIIYLSIAVLAEDSAIVPPSRVTIDRAIITDQGVEINWLEADVGTYPIQNYLIQRSHDGSNYELVGTVEATSRNYIDAGGNLDDKYRINAVDNQSPANKSNDSESIAATASTPGSVIDTPTTALIDKPPSTTVPSPQPLDISPKLNSENTSQPAAPLTSSLDIKSTDIVQSIDKAFAKKDSIAAADKVTELQLNDRNILSLFSKLSPLNQKAEANSCQIRSDSLEAYLHLLPEDRQLDGLLAQAACDSIQDLAP
ncbi:MAG: hypothetical protein NVS1B10_05110 [Candidatus Saccharimonadales bacterium]